MIPILRSFRDHERGTLQIYIGTRFMLKACCGHKLRLYLLEGVKRAEALGIHKLIIEGDNLTTINTMKKK